MPSSEKVIFVGDVHGQIKYLNEIASRNPEILHIQIGDLGMGFFKEINLEPNIKFIRGNHDSPNECIKHPQYLGDYGFSNEIYFISGGCSIDYMYRIPDVSWWWNEELDYHELIDAISVALESKPDIIISHECPSSIQKQIHSHHIAPSRTSQALESIFREYKPKLWIFGHHHTSWRRNVLGTYFICLDELETFETEVIL